LINYEYIYKFFYKKLKISINMSMTFVTTHGKLKFELYCELVPIGTKNFLALCASGFYNNTIFHRNM